VKTLFTLQECPVPMNGPARYALAATPISLLVFLYLSSFFTTWGGQVISFRPSQVEEPAVLSILIVTDDRTEKELLWPAELVSSLQVPANITGIPPVTLPEDGPVTTKSPFTLQFEITQKDQPKKVVSTLSARALYSAVLLWVLGFFLNNMRISGSPWSFTPSAFKLPPPMPTGGNNGEGPGQGSTSRKGPPPGKRRRGQGRRG
jgi:hypothetical protein